MSLVSKWHDVLCYRVIGPHALRWIVGVVAVTVASFVALKHLSQYPLVSVLCAGEMLVACLGLILALYCREQYIGHRYREMRRRAPTPARDILPRAYPAPDAASRMDMERDADAIARASDEQFEHALTAAGLRS